MIGNIYDKLTVIAPLEKKYHKTFWLCRCECGTAVEVAQHILQNKTIKKCCYDCLNLNIIPEQSIIIPARTCIICHTKFHAKTRTTVCSSECSQIKHRINNRRTYQNAMNMLSNNPERRQCVRNKKRLFQQTQRKKSRLNKLISLSSKLLGDTI